jgi:indole-3-glycerol phosphate synthase
LARAYERGGATCLSVLTDGPSFQGDDNDLVSVRAASALPCLRKEFLIDPWQVAESRALGADAVLVILALVDDSLARELMSEARRLGIDVLTETHDLAELRRAATLGANLIGVNNRDLRTFVTDLAVTERLAEEIPASAVLVTESGVHTPEDAARLEAAGARAMLVGESLMRADDVEAATRTLLRLPSRST